MENFFSTIAQITFTVIGLFFVSITFDAETRKFWFYEKFYNRYTYLTFLVMLFPGFISIGGLVSAKESEFPAWTVTGIVFLLIYFWAFSEFRKLRKSSDYKKIKDIEYSLDVYGTLRFHLIFLLVFPIYGFLSYITKQYSILLGVETFVKMYISFSVVLSVLPIMVFTKRVVEKESDIQVTTTFLDVQQPIHEEKNINYPLFFLTAFFFFVVGLLFPVNKRNTK